MSPVVYSKNTTEEDMRAKYIDPRLREWDEKDLVDRGHSYKPGEIKPEWGSKKFHRVKVRDFPDYTLRLDKDFVVAVIEAKSNFLHYEDGMQQGERYAKDLECQFAYSTNGKAINKEMGTGIKEWDNIKKQYNTRADFPTIEELKERLREDKRYKEKFDLLLKTIEKISDELPKIVWYANTYGSEIEDRKQRRKEEEEERRERAENKKLEMELSVYES